MLTSYNYTSELYWETLSFLTASHESKRKNKQTKQWNDVVVVSISLISIRLFLSLFFHFIFVFHLHVPITMFCLFLSYIYPNSYTHEQSITNTAQRKCPSLGIYLLRKNSEIKQKNK